MTLLSNLFRIIRNSGGRRAPVFDAFARPPLELDLAVLLDELQEIAAICDINLRLLYVNRGFADLIGSEPSALIGQTLGEELFLTDTAQLEASIRSIETGEPQRFLHENPGAHGGTVHDVRCMPVVSAAGSVVGLRIIGSDRTVSARLQAELNASGIALARSLEQVKATTSVRSVFFSNLSHEIRTPMNAILGLTQLAEREATHPLQADRLAKISTAARHLLRVINDSLDLAKIDAGKMTLKLADFSRDALVDDTFEMVREQARKKGLELVVDTDHLPRRMRGDATRLSQMLINLLSNAVKFTDAGWVRLRAQWLNDQVDDRLHLRFEVQDTGPGITAEQQKRLFVAFEQVELETSEVREGSGLGLALVRQLAQAMGGDAGVESKPGSGSIFWFTVWLDPAWDPDGAHARKLEDHSILIVDDLYESRQVLSEDARRLGLRVEAVGSGEDAIARLEHGAVHGRLVDALLIDRQMKGLDGVETLRQIRALLGDRTPVSILVTSGDSTDVQYLTGETGFDLVLTKPITTSALENALVRILFPQRSAVPAHDPPPSPSESVEQQLLRHAAGRTVLLAEDNPVNREIVKALLSAVRLEVDEAVDGVVAVEMAQRRRYDLILLDLRMPRMSGLEVARRLRAEGQTVPIVAMTANAYAEDRAACLAAGMNDHVAKPMTSKSLYHAVLKWLPDGASASTR